MIDEAEQSTIKQIIMTLINAGIDFNAILLLLAALVVFYYLK